MEHGDAGGAGRAKIEAAYRERGAEFLTWARRRTGSDEDAEDLLHDAFLGALRGAARLEEVADPLGWIFAGLRNRAVDLWRKKGRRGERERVSIEAVEEIVAAVGLDPADELVREELSGAISDAIAALRPEEREVIEAQVFKGRSFREISESTGIPIDTLAARKRRGVAKIARALRSWIAD